MKTLLTILIFMGLGFCQQTNPCEDQLFVELELKIKNKGLEELNEREWQYWVLKTKECEEYKNDNTKYEKEMMKIEQERLNMMKEKKESDKKQQEYWKCIALILLSYLFGPLGDI